MRDSDKGISIFCNDSDEIMAYGKANGVPDELTAMVAYTRRMLDEDWLGRAELQELLLKLVQELMFYAAVHGMDLMKIVDTLADMAHKCCVLDDAEGTG